MRCTRHAVFLLLSLAAPRALATWSIILVDTRTGEIAVGSATCLSNFDLRDGTPVLIPGVGAATAQSFVDSTGQNRVFIRDRLAEGVAPASIVAQLATFDSGYQTRQYGIVDAAGRAATFSGTGANAWAGGQTGTFISHHGGQPSTIAYAIQGNILTGAPVITASVQAVIQTEGDLASKLMAGMQAARQMGGDGRCSCSSSAPMSCGSPPAVFTKSAHIGYMLIARAGDREGSNGIYRASIGAGNITPADLTGDGLPELLVTNFNASSLSVQRNTSAPHLPFPMFAALPTNVLTSPANSGPRAVAMADVTGDGILDALLTASTGGTVLIFPGQAAPAGSFAAPYSVPVGVSPRPIVTGDFNGDSSPDFAVANQVAASVSVRLNDGSGQFSAVPDVSVGSQPIDMVIGNFAGTAHDDLAVLCRGANTLQILIGDGAGQFTSGPQIPVSANGVSITSGHFDGDAQLDLAVITDITREVRILLNQGGAWAPTALTPPGMTILADVAAGDVNGDGHCDLVCVGGNRFAVFLNTGPGVFEHDRTYVLSSSVQAAALADLDGDGDLDLAMPSPNLQSSIIVQNYGTFFNDGIGCATGRYYMNFNIAFQSSAAPDPILQLQTLCDAWRDDLAGIPDAVLSSAGFSAPWLPANGSSTAVLTVSLRDIRGEPAAAFPGSVSIEHAPGSAGSSTIGEVIAQGAGVFTAVITAGATPGLDRFRIRAFDDPALGGITLMPDAALTITPACYANCDNSALPPVLNVADFSCFLAKFAEADPYANCDQSTTAPTLNIADFSCFLSTFAAGCP